MEDTGDASSCEDLYREYCERGVYLELKTYGIEVNDFAILSVACQCGPGCTTREVVRQLRKYSGSFAFMDYPRPLPIIRRETYDIENAIQRLLDAGIIAIADSEFCAAAECNMQDHAVFSDIVPRPQLNEVQPTRRGAEIYLRMAERLQWGWQKTYRVSPTHLMRCVEAAKDDVANTEAELRRMCSALDGEHRHLVHVGPWYAQWWNLRSSGYSWIQRTSPVAFQKEWSAESPTYRVHVGALSR